MNPKIHKLAKAGVRIAAGAAASRARPGRLRTGRASRRRKPDGTDPWKRSPGYGSSSSKPTSRPRTASP
ncbi:MAG: hypothetical protein M0C28_12185 [Candidatus Moduliflexus flocculans]|nr:hypothetical protein [Candidatus Moduliflexus flocculans]